MDERRDSRQLIEETFEGLTQFFNYLQNAINSIKNREIEASWAKVGEERGRLEVLDKKYRIVPAMSVLPNREKGWYTIESWPPDIEPDFDEEIRIRKTRSKYPVTQERFFRRGNSGFVKLPLKDTEPIEALWGYDTFNLIPAWVDELITFHNVEQNSKPLIFTVDGEHIYIEGDLQSEMPLWIDDRLVFFEEVESFEHPDDLELQRDEKGLFVVTDSIPEISGAKVTEEVMDIDVSQIIPEAEILYEDRQIYRLPVRDPEAWDKIYKSGGVKFRLGNGSPGSLIAFGSSWRKKTKTRSKISPLVLLLIFSLTTM